ncbi:PAS domain-containing sensor histidine kinase [Hymenobacter sp. 15J16-1T3B]|uniref:PAS domain-containing sensor histidine kinase n=1 Tax=Hymenobacter sp. 15J16-1T3B TaxID=2886941 RepID=UPI001D12C789|nr:PAS domain-containing sensor histidine kinase [Hymenobacter sp. 15J16-1T3B]MCC3159903.1 PAS domain-containing sensor histidine kinase [Hymenobacter sp. 15J16-1T3B]
MNLPEDEEPLPALDLRLTQENLEDLYEHAPCGYCTCLPDGTLVKLNQTLLGWLGYRREELVARRCLQQLLTVGGRVHYETHCAPLLLLQGQVREMSYLLRRRDGSTLPVLLSAVLLREPDGTPLAVRVSLFDITERRKYEQELLRAKVQAEEQREQLARANEQLRAKNEQLTRINADLDSFVYTASHDLKQPINNMVGLFEELRRSVTFHDAEATQMMCMFEDALGQILATIDGLTQVVQLQRALEQMPAEPVALQPFTEEIIRSLQPLPAGATFELDFAAAPVLRMARPGLHSLLYNLLSNALKYAVPGRPPRVRVRTTRAPHATVLEVQDNGRGIDLQRHSRELFQLFRRFHPEVAGTGMGLYLVNRLARQAGGRVEVDSTVDAGTTFRIFLPREDEASQPPAGLTFASPPSSLSEKGRGSQLTR